MDYEKIHKETLEGLKRLVSEGNITEDVAKKICPDFIMDSEDERIRKELLAVINDLVLPDEQKARFNAYLEKQKEQKPVEYLNKDKAYAIMTKLTNLSYSKLISINSDEYKKLHEITSDVRDLLDYPIEQKPAECIEFDNEFKNQVSHLLASVLNKEWEYDKGLVEYAAQQLLGYAKHEIKPVEWSEDDIDKMVTARARKSGATKSEMEFYRQGIKDTLKSIRPQPKSIISDTDKSNLRDVPAIIRKSNHPFKENIALIIEKYL